MSILDETRDAAKRDKQRPDGAESATILAGPKPRGIAPKPYQAFGAPTSDQQVRLIIYAKKIFMMPQYAVMYDVFFDGAGEFVGLVFPHHRVKIYGRNLMPMVDALRTNKIEWIREYVPGFFVLPEDPNEPVITVIDTDQVQNPFSPDLAGTDNTTRETIQ